MADAIIVENLSKQFRIGGKARETMLREKLVNLLKHPFKPGGQERDTIWALKDVSLTIKEGEVVGIIGRNGAGKSTLLKILSRITYPTSGRVAVHGRIASLLEVGTGFHEELTGRENIFLNGSILGMTRAEVVAKFDAIVDFAAVEKFIDTPIKHFSSGMRLRLGFAVAANLDPDVLVIDEILAVGDAGFQKKCLNAMEDLHSGGRTVLFVSHNMAAVENLCSRAVWIDKGQVRQDGEARNVIQSYMATFAGNELALPDLATVKDRRGTGDIRYTGIEFLDYEGNRQTVIRSGDALIIRLHYHAEKAIPYPSFGFRLHTELGTLITETSTWHNGIDIPVVPPGDGQIDVKFDLINLLPSRYSLSLGLTGPASIVYDSLEHCARLDVEVSDVYGCGRVIDSRYGIVFFPQHWEFQNVAVEAEHFSKSRA
jgi:lipopolysaccharide transport system ATP-binding protein